MNLKLYLLREHGMFSVINETLDQLYLADLRGYQFVIDDETLFQYKDKNKEGSPWNYFFKDCFDITEPYDKQELPELPMTSLRVGNIVAPRDKRNVKGAPPTKMFLPPDRGLVKGIIDKYIKLNEEILDKIEHFKKENFEGYIIGLHIRGPGKMDDGITEHLNNLGLPAEIPYQLYFAQVDKVLDKHPAAEIFLCTDAQVVIDKCQERYKDKLFFTNSMRSEEGEMHLLWDKHKYELGVDVLVDAYLLSSTDYFIHSISNVANFVICNNPNLQHVSILNDD
jgi:hypothetical protein